MPTKSNSQISTLEDDTVAAQAPEAAVIKGENFDDQLEGQFEMVTIHSGNDEAGSDAVAIGLKPDGKGGNVERHTPRYAFSATPVKG